MNMSYCRFRNTALDLEDCVNHWTEENRMEKDPDYYESFGDDEAIEEIRRGARLSEDEERGRQRIIQLAKDLLGKEGYDVNPM